MTCEVRGKKNRFKRKMPTNFRFPTSVCIAKADSGGPVVGMTLDSEGVRKAAVVGLGAKRYSGVFIWRPYCGEGEGGGRRRREICN